MSVQSSIPDINRYTIISKIGEGGFSKVYRVKDIKTGEYYAAKISNFMIDEDTKESEEALLLFREVNLMTLLNHPSILKFVGYYPTNFEEDPVSTIITELASNGSLRDILNMENLGLSPDEWNLTKKLINIYGIASGMSYLHSHNILHRDLKPENILIDQYLYPKISDFGFSKITDFLSASMNIQSQKGIKGTPAYMAPEIMATENYSKSGDVYAFGFIVFEILSNEEPFKNFNIYKLMKKVMNEGYRPKINEDIPDAYRSIIERCWSQEAKDRPTFDEIVGELKNNSDFITELIDEVEFLDYVDFIDSYRSTFDVSNRAVHFSDFIKKQGRNKTLKIFTIDKTDSEKPTITISSINLKPIEVHDKKEELDEKKEHNVKEEHFEKEKLSKNEIKYKNLNIRNKSKRDVEHDTDKLLFPKIQFDELSKVNQSLVLEAEKDSTKCIEVGKFLITGDNDFPEIILLGMAYIRRSINQHCIDAHFYYIQQLIKGKIIPQNISKALDKLFQIYNKQDIYLKSTQNKQMYLLLVGLANRKMNKYLTAIEYFKKGIDIDGVECMYQYSKMLFIGEGINRNIDGSIG